MDLSVLFLDTNNMAHMGLIKNLITYFSKHYLPSAAYFVQVILLLLSLWCGNVTRHPLAYSSVHGKTGSAPGLSSVSANT